MKLKFQKGNAKLSKEILTFSLPAGWSCPGALECKSKVKHGKVIDGPHNKFRCFATSEEARYPSVHKARQHNYSMLKNLSSGTEMKDLIIESLPNKDKGIVRIHASGDFFSEKYFLAWCRVAQLKKDWTFYAYTKSIRYWIYNKHLVPDNLILTASFGGKYDALINKNGLKHSLVVFSEEEAEALGYPIDHDDSLAMTPNVNFALLLHGIQPKGSEASRALVELKKKGWNGYGHKS